LALPKIEVTLVSGTRFGPYEILLPLGAGGMGEVYRARDTRLDRTVAIKILPADVAADTQRRERFRREARAISSLTHPHICTLYDIGQQDGADFLVMEYLAGETLAHRLLRGALPLDEVLRVATQLADALDAAHRAGLTHRDLKPANVMLTTTGAKVLDFGVAKWRGGDPDSLASAAQMTAHPTLTQMGSVVGTLQYMAPEQIEGKPVDARADLFALGAIVYEMTTGRKAFEGASSASMMAAILTSTPPTMSAVQPVTPAALDRVVRKCLAKDPTRRWQTAADLRDELAWIEEDLRAHSAFQATVSQTAPRAAPDVRTVVDLPRSRPRRARVLVMTTVGAAVAASALTVSLDRFLPFSPAVVRFQQLTFRRGYINTGRFGPEGQTVIFSAAWDGGPVRVYTMRLDGPASSPLDLPPADPAAVGRNGQLAVLLAGAQAGTLAQVPLAGGAPRHIAADVQLAEWLSDGQFVVVRGTPSSVEFPLGTVRYTSSGDIDALRASPSGDEVAFLDHPAPHDGGGFIVVLDRQGRTRRVSRYWENLRSLAWTPDGREVWFSASHRGIQTSLYGTAAFGRERLLAPMMGDVRLLDITRMGRVLVNRCDWQSRLLFGAPGEPERDLYQFDAGEVAALADDGSALVFREGGESDAVVGRDWPAYIRKTDGSPAVRLGDGYATSLSPDGKWVIVIEMGSQSPAQLALLPTGAGERRPLTRDGIHHQDARWMPDGKQFVFAGAEPGHPSRLFVQALSGGAPRSFTPDAVGGPFEISADGTMVAAMGPTGLGLYPIDGSSPRPVGGTEPGDRPVRWDANGTSLYVWAAGDLPARIFRIDLAARQRALWKTLAPRDATGVLTLQGPVFARDPRVYAYGVPVRLCNLYLVEGLK
jgi:hypothetical protein